MHTLRVSVQIHDILTKLYSFTILIKLYQPCSINNREEQHKFSMMYYEEKGNVIWHRHKSASFAVG